MTTYTVKFYGSSSVTPRVLGMHKTRDEAVRLLLGQLDLKMDKMTNEELKRFGYDAGVADILDGKRDDLTIVDDSGESAFYFAGHRYWMTPEPEAKTSKPGELAKAAREYAEAAGALEAAFLNEQRAAEKLRAAMNGSKHND